MVVPCAAANFGIVSNFVPAGNFPEMIPLRKFCAITRLFPLVVILTSLSVILYLTIKVMSRVISRINEIIIGFLDFHPKGIFHLYGH